MCRFVKVNNEYINMDIIARYWKNQDGTIYIEMTDGTMKSVPPGYADTLWDSLNGFDYIVQVIPVKEPLYLVHKDDDGSHFTTPIFYLGLLASGGIKAIENTEGWFDLADENYFSGCMGEYHKYQLDEFPDIQIIDESEVNP